MAMENRLREILLYHERTACEGHSLDSVTVKAPLGGRQRGCLPHIRRGGERKPEPGGVAIRLDAGW